MKRKEIAQNLESIYIDYYDGLYNETQLKHMLVKLYKIANVNSSVWSDMVLDAQWKYATEEDFEIKRNQLKS